MMERPASFWGFSVRAYAEPGVADACLALQERHGLDVNLLLLCCWFGRTRGVVDEPLWDRVLAFSGPWAENVVRPLRAARTWMKHTGRARPGISNGAYEALREEIKQIELRAEKLQQDTLEELAGNSPAKCFDSTSEITYSIMNLKDYIGHCKVEMDSASRSGLVRVVTAAIDGATLDEVTGRLDATFRRGGNPEGFPQ